MVVRVPFLIDGELRVRDESSATAITLLVPHGQRRSRSPYKRRQRNDGTFGELMDDGNGIKVDTRTEVLEALCLVYEGHLSGDDGVC